MSTGVSDVSFLEFLDWMGAKGLVPQNTAHARKAVANKVLAALEEDERQDVTALDIEHVMLRFSNKFGRRYTPGSMRTYRSRFESSLADFRAYIADPVGFRPSRRAAPKSNGSRAEGAEPKAASKSSSNRSHAAVATPPLSEAGPIPGNVVPIQIRDNLTIKLGPIPFDFSAAEARRVANVILALAAGE